MQLKLCILNTIENEVDGDAFLLLSEEQIKLLITAMGPQVKFAQKHKLLCKSLPDKQKVTSNDSMIALAIHFGKLL